MKHHKLISLGASVFAMSGVVHLLHAKDFVDFNNLCVSEVTKDTRVKPSGRVDIEGGCTIQVKGAKLEVVGVKVAVQGNLKIEDTSNRDSGEVSELVFRNTHVTATGKVEIKKSWDGGVVFRNNWVATGRGEDLKVKPEGGGDLIFRNNRGEVGDDVRFGEDTMEGDIVVRNNRIEVGVTPDDGSDFNTQTESGNILVRNNDFGATEKANLQIKSGSGDIAVRTNRFGTSVGAVDIGTGGLCESRQNAPDGVDDSACK